MNEKSSFEKLLIHVLPKNFKCIDSVAHIYATGNFKWVFYFNLDKKFVDENASEEVLKMFKRLERVKMAFSRYDINSEVLPGKIDYQKIIKQIYNIADMLHLVHPDEGCQIFFQY